MDVNGGMCVYNIILIYLYIYIYHTMVYPFFSIKMAMIGTYCFPFRQPWASSQVRATLPWAVSAPCHMHPGRRSSAYLDSQLHHFRISRILYMSSICWRLCQLNIPGLPGWVMWRSRTWQLTPDGYDLNHGSTADLGQAGLRRLGPFAETLHESPENMTLWNIM